MAPRTGRDYCRSPLPPDLLIFITKEADCENGKRLHNPRPWEEMSRVEGGSEDKAETAWLRRSTEHPPLCLTRRAGEECRSPRNSRLGCLPPARPAPRELSRRPRPRLPGRSPRRAARLPHVPPARLAAARSRGGPRGRGSGAAGEHG